MLIGSLDIGGTKTIAAITDQQGNIIRQATFPTDVQDYQQHFSCCCSTLKELATQQRVTVPELYGVGINVPGMVEYPAGILTNAPFAAWRNIPVREIFRNQLGTQAVFVDNDVKSCALGELYFGYRDRYPSYVWVTVSTGIGAAVVIDGRIHRGDANLAGELGHIVVEYQSPRQCFCGKLGCLEAYSSGTAISAQVRKIAAVDPTFRGELHNAGLQPDAAGAAFLAELGNRSAMNIYAQAAAYLARGLASAINLLNPSAIILGGGVANSLHLLLPEIRRHLKGFLVDQLMDTEILQTRLGYEAALIGTVALVLDENAKCSQERQSV